jgi:hypothetical protein
VTSLPALRIELDVFSGRANPSWLLTPAECEEIVTRLRRLASAATPSAPASLGYRGFILHWSEGGGERPWAYVTPGVVRMAQAAGGRALTDSEGIEEWLRQQAIARGYGSLIRPARREEDRSW